MDHQTQLGPTSNTFTALGGRQLQHFYTVEVVAEDDGWAVYVNSTIHVNRRVRMPVSFGKSFSIAEILRDRDLLSQIYSRYGNVFACTCH